MHMQIRVNPRRSPASVAAVLKVLAEEGINLVGAGGSNLEFEDGEFAIAVDHGQEDETLRILDREGFGHREFHADEDPELKLCWLTNEPGQLKSCVDDATLSNGDDRSIRDILIGVATSEGIPVHIFSEVRSTDPVQG